MSSGKMYEKRDLNLGKMDKVWIFNYFILIRKDGYGKKNFAI